MARKEILLVPQIYRLKQIRKGGRNELLWTFLCSRVSDRSSSFGSFPLVQTNPDNIESSR